MGRWSLTPPVHLGPDQVLKGLREEWALSLVRRKGG